MGAQENGISKIFPKFNASKIQNVQKKIVVITGANSGVGYVCALELAKKKEHR